MTAKIAFVYTTPPTTLTGGQIYERKFFNAIEADKSLAAEYVVSQSNNKIQKLTAPLRNLFLYRRLKQYDLVVFNSSKFAYFLPLALLLKARNIKRLVIHHHYMYREQKGLKRILYHWLENLYLKVNTPLSPSPYTADQIKSEANRTPLVCLIPFDHPTFDSLPTKVGKLLFVGTIENRKGLHFLFESLRLIGENKVPYSLEIVGKTIDPTYRQQIEDFAELHKLNVHFNGYLSDQELQDMYRSSDMFVFPSQLEGYGMALNEAMAYALPVVTFNNSAMPYSVTDGQNGFLVETGDTKAMATAIEKIICDRRLRQSLSEGAKRHADTLCDEARFGDRVRELIHSIVD